MRKIRKNFALLLALLLLLSMAAFQPLTVKAQTKTITVPDDYSDIQMAINHANNGDTVFVKAGTYKYNEQNTTLARPHSGDPDYGIMVNKSISLIGENRSSIISMDYNGGTAVCIAADGVTFTGFTVTSNVQSIFSDIRSLAFWESNCSIINNDFQRTVVGIGGGMNISCNNFEGADNFGMVVTLYDSIISHNKVINNFLGGIDVSDSSNVAIEENDVTGNGIRHYSKYPLGNNGAGISLTTYNQDVDSNISIYKNNIAGNARFGIQFNGAVSNSTIFNNNITNNGVGVNLGNYALIEYSIIGNGTKIYFNNIADNTKNAYIETEFPYNLTDHIYNHFIGNASDVVSWDNGAVGNFWSDYSGNGSYIVNENNIDYHPLLQLVDVSSIAPTPTASPLNYSNSLLVVVALAIVAIFVLTISLLFYRRTKKPQI